MKKIILILLSVLCLGASEFDLSDFNVSSKDNNIYTLVQKYIDLNRKMKEFQATSNDENSSSYKKTLNEFERDKKNILAKLPDIIVSQKVDEEEVRTFLKTKDKLLNLQKQNINRPFEYIEATLNLAYLNRVESFYSSLFELEKLFKETASSEEISSAVDKALENLQSVSSVDLDSYKAKITRLEDLKQIEHKEEILTNTTQSYREILK